jgi:hypothetical protein
VVQILFIVYHFILMVVYLIRVYVWTKGNPRRSFKDGYCSALLFALVRIALDTWNDAMFYFLFAITGYWFVFYKLQSKIYLLIPDKDDRSNYLPFDVLQSTTHS